MALAWLLHKGPDTKRQRYLEENTAAAAVSRSAPRSAEEIAALDAALPPGMVSRPRYGDQPDGAGDPATTVPMAA